MKAPRKRQALTPAVPQTLDLFADEAQLPVTPIQTPPPTPTAPALVSAPPNADEAASRFTLTAAPALSLPSANDADALLADLDAWVTQGWLRELDRSFALFLRQLDPGVAVPVLLGAALASYQLGRGHVCLDLNAALAGDALMSARSAASRAQADEPADEQAEQAAHSPADWLQSLTVEAWKAALRASALCAEGAGATPLVLSGPRLYLRRYWQYEREVRLHIDARLQAAPVAQPERIRPVLDLLFTRPGDSGALNWQKMACALALRQRFAIVTGGPGTGKTTTVVRLLALLQSLALEDAHGDATRALRIKLAAPTGKAAARLTESIRGALDGLPWNALPGGPALREKIPSNATTLHRLLGSRPDSRRLRHHAGNPLALDVLVVDEASMVDLEMMAALLQALPPNARLVLLGDKDQLASVEAGAVLGELCRRADAGHYNAATVQWLQASSGQQPPPALCDAQGQPLDQAVAMLRVSHRFTANSGIGQLASAVNAGNAPAARALWKVQRDDLRALTLRSEPQAMASDVALRQLILADAPKDAQGDDQPVGPAYCLQQMQAQRPAPDALRAQWDAWAGEALQNLGRFQLLCALREGPWGVSGLNTVVSEVLHGAGLISATQGWYPGRPVLVTRNDHALGLMNGDVGLVLELPARFDADSGQPMADAGLARRVAFAAGDGSGGVRWVLPARLQAVETVFAMTVHKSQGSEFQHTAFVLPDAGNPVLTRELVYTGITRAKRWFTLVAGTHGERVLDEAIRRRVQRASGLADAAEPAGAR